MRIRKIKKIIRKRFKKIKNSIIIKWKSIAIRIIILRKRKRNIIKRVIIPIKILRKNGKPKKNTFRETKFNEWKKAINYIKINIKLRRNK